VCTLPPSGSATAGLVHENLPHQASGNPVKVAAALELRISLAK
jgi:hypothetical protein